MKRRDFLQLAGMTVAGATMSGTDTLPAVIPQQEITVKPSGLWYFTATYQPYHEWVEEEFSVWANVLGSDKWKNRKDTKNSFVSFDCDPSCTTIQKQHFQSLLDKIELVPPQACISIVALEKITPVQTIVDGREGWEPWFPLTKSGERQIFEVPCGPVRYTLTLRGIAPDGLSGKDFMDDMQSTRCPMIGIEQARITT